MRKAGLRADPIGQALHMDLGSDSDEIPHSVLLKRAECDLCAAFANFRWRLIRKL